MNRKPLVKIGIPTYNNPEGLQSLVEYLLYQSYKNILIFISDNGDIPCELPNDHRIAYYKQPTNIGIAGNFDFLYKMAGESEYFMWMSDDDKFSYNYISACVDFLEKHPDYQMCAGRVFMSNNGLTLDVEMNTTSLSSFKRMFYYLRHVEKNGIIHAVFRNNEERKEFPNCVGGDWVFVARMTLKGKIRNIKMGYMLKDANGMSSCRKKIVSIWTKSKFTALFFETYTAYQIAKRLPYSILVFLFLNIKFLTNSIKKRLK